MCFLGCIHVHVYIYIHVYIYVHVHVRDVHVYGADASDVKKTHTHLILL